MAYLLWSGSSNQSFLIFVEMLLKGPVILFNTFAILKKKYRLGASVTFSQASPCWPRLQGNNKEKGAGPQHLPVLMLNTCQEAQRERARQREEGEARHAAHRGSSEVWCWYMRKVHAHAGERFCHFRRLFNPVQPIIYIKCDLK